MLNPYYISMDQVLYLISDISVLLYNFLLFQLQNYLKKKMNYLSNYFKICYKYQEAVLQ